MCKKVILIEDAIVVKKPIIVKKTITRNADEPNQFSITTMRLDEARKNIHCHAADVVIVAAFTEKSVKEIVPFVREMHAAGIKPIIGISTLRAYVEELLKAGCTHSLTLDRLPTLLKELMSDQENTKGMFA